MNAGHPCAAAGFGYGALVMNPDVPPVSAPPVAAAQPPTAPPPMGPGGSSSATPPPPKPAAQGYRWLLLGCGGLIALLLVAILSVVLTIWWMNRPIKPVVLSEKEKQTVEQKLSYLEATPTGKLRVENLSEDKPKPEPDRLYLAGSKELRLTEREINGLLNENTDLGKSVRLEFGRDAINAYVATPIPDDVPVMGGKMFRARGRFKLSIGNGGKPYAILEDVTVFGLSLPKDWLGGIKGENLLSDAVRSSNGTPAFRGVKSLRIEPGAIVIKVED